MRNTVQNVGSAGINRDVKPQFLPPEVWSDGRNVRFKKNRVYAMGGCQKVLTSDVTGILNSGLIKTVATKFILYHDATDVFSFDGVTENEITRAVGGDYTCDEDNLFDIRSFNGYGLLNQFNDIPQLWNPSAGSNLLVDLPNWDTTWRTRYLRPFKSFLIALNILEDTSYYPYKMRWSAPAEAGAIPITWDETDATNLAGEFSFPDTDTGFLMGGLELGEQFFVYKERAIWALQYVPDPSVVLNRTLVVKNIGLTVPRSLVELPYVLNQQSAHFFVGDEQMFVMDGTRVYPVFEEVFKKEIVTLRGENYINRSFSVVHPFENELWFCIPQAGDEFPTLAFTFNFLNNSYSIRELSGASNIIAGTGFTFTETDRLIDIPFSDDALFSDGVGFYGTVTPVLKSVMMETSPGMENLFYVDTGVLDYDQVTPYYSYVIKESLATVKNDSRNPEATIVDYDVRKLVNSFIPKLVEGAMQVSIGKQEYENVPITWSTALIVDGSKYRWDLSQPISGRFISFKFESYGSEPFSFAGFDYDVHVLGKM